MQKNNENDIENKEEFGITESSFIRDDIEAYIVDAKFNNEVDFDYFDEF